MTKTRKWLLATAALWPLLGGPVQAEPSTWSVYNYTTRSCNAVTVSPETLINGIALVYRAAPQVEKQYDAHGKVKGLTIQVPLADSDKALSWTMYRTAEDCNLFAKLRDIMEPNEYN